MKTCTFVTGNPNKVIEVNAILGDKIAIEPLALDIPEIQGTLEEIAADKCRRASKIVGAWSLRLIGWIWNWLIHQVDGPVIVEDSALEFNAMNKLPGPYMWVWLTRGEASNWYWRIEFIAYYPVACKLGQKIFPGILRKRRPQQTIVFPYGQNSRGRLYVCIYYGPHDRPNRLSRAAQGLSFIASPYLTISIPHHGIYWRAESFLQGAHLYLVKLPVDYHTNGFYLLTYD